MEISFHYWTACSGQDSLCRHLKNCMFSESQKISYHHFPEQFSENRFSGNWKSDTLTLEPPFLYLTGRNYPNQVGKNRVIFNIYPIYKLDTIVGKFQVFYQWRTHDSYRNCQFDCEQKDGVSNQCLYFHSILFLTRR